LGRLANLKHQDKPLTLLAAQAVPLPRKRVEGQKQSGAPPLLRFTWAEGATPSSVGAAREPPEVTGMFDAAIGGRVATRPYRTPMQFGTVSPSDASRVRGDETNIQMVSKTKRFTSVYVSKSLLFSLRSYLT